MHCSQNQVCHVSCLLPYQTQKNLILDGCDQIERKWWKFHSQNEFHCKAKWKKKHHIHASNSLDQTSKYCPVHLISLHFVDRWKQEWYSVSYLKVMMHACTSVWSSTLAGFFITPDPRRMDWSQHSFPDTLLSLFQDKQDKRLEKPRASSSSIPSDPLCIPPSLAHIKENIETLGREHKRYLCHDLLSIPTHMHTRCHPHEHLHNHPKSFPVLWFPSGRGKRAWNNGDGAHSLVPMSWWCESGWKVLRALHDETNGSPHRGETGVCSPSSVHLPRSSCPHSTLDVLACAS